MDRNSPEYRKYTSILEEELIPAMGCTEPIAVAYCAAVARETLGMAPDRVEISASGNIIKNVKSVVVPNTNGMRGIAAAAAALNVMFLFAILFSFASASARSVARPLRYSTMFPPAMQQPRRRIRKIPVRAGVRRRRVT